MAKAPGEGVASPDGWGLGHSGATGSPGWQRRWLQGLESMPLLPSEVPGAEWILELAGFPGRQLAGAPSVWPDLSSAAGSGTGCRKEATQGSSSK